MQWLTSAFEWLQKERDQFWKHEKNSWLKLNLDISIMRTIGRVDDLNEGVVEGMTRRRSKTTLLEGDSLENLFPFFSARVRVEK